MTQESAALNIKNQLLSSIDNEKTEELKMKPVQGQFFWELERPLIGKEKFLAWLSS
jgi:hypothetical protein